MCGGCVWSSFQGLALCFPSSLLAVLLYGGVIGVCFGVVLAVMFCNSFSYCIGAAPITQLRTHVIQ